VSGLITGQDLIGQLRERKESGESLGKVLLIPSNMLRTGEQTFLDDVTVRNVEKELGMKVIALEPGGKEFMDAILNGDYPECRDNGNENSAYIQAYRKDKK